MNLNSLSITVYIGVGFILLGGLNASRLVNMSPQFYFGFSLAGFLFVLFDFFSNQQGEATTKAKEVVFTYLSRVSLLCSILSIIVVPHLVFQIDKEILQHINDTLVLVGLGLVIATIGLREGHESLRLLKSEAEFLDKVAINLKSIGETTDSLSDKVENMTEKIEIIAEINEKKN